MRTSVGWINLGWIRKNRIEGILCHTKSERKMSTVDSQISQIYRGTPIGVALTRSLNAMIVSQQISGATAVKIMVRLLIFVQQQKRRLTSTIRDNIQWVQNSVFRLQCSFVCTVNFNLVSGYHW